jgi:hypothetical protein
MTEHGELVAAAAARVIPRHREWAELATAGWHHGKIAKQAGVTRQAVTEALRTPQGKAYLAELRRAHSEAVVARARGKADHLLSQAFKIIRGRDTPVGVKADLTKWLLDRVLFTGDRDQADAAGADPASAMRSFEAFMAAGVRSIAATPSEGAEARLERSGEEIEADYISEDQDAESVADAAVEPQEERDDGTQ